ENQGPATARNVGVSLAKGDLIFFTDADCVPDPDWLEEMSAPFERPEIAAVKGAYHTEQKDIIARFAQVEFEERFALLKQQESIDMVDTYSAGFRREIFLGLGGFDTRFPKADNEDTEFSYRMAEHGHTMVFTHRALVRHLNHPDSVLRYLRLKFSRGYWRLMVYRLHPERAIKDSYTPQTLKLQILVLFSGMTGAFILIFSPFLGITLLFSSLLFFLILSFPFFRIVYKHDKIVACCTPLLLALRAAAIGSGVLWGLWHLRLGKGGLHHHKKKD
ncbi:MAG: glycosyltransferase, partial [Candidatus Electrothrix sp. AUS1_2]|nr:glycosyltransferase [Candidatus Electrothrix sp. AUS1_2]